MFGGNYNVVLKIGFLPKKGTMRIRVMDGNRVDGMLSIFGKEEGFSGNIENGTIDFTGNIKLPVGETEYKAIGTIDGNTLKLKLDTQYGIYKMTGTKQ